MSSLDENANFEKKFENKLIFLSLAFGLPMIIIFRLLDRPGTGNLAASMAFATTLIWFYAKKYSPNLRVIIYMAIAVVVQVFVILFIGERPSLDHGPLILMFTIANFLFNVGILSVLKKMHVLRIAGAQVSPD